VLVWLTPPSLVLFWLTPPSLVLLSLTPPSLVLWPLTPPPLVLPMLMQLYWRGKVEEVTSKRRHRHSHRRRWCCRR
jgi:hypothetical protein